ncbi:MAG: glycosyltransferase family 2 protein, partial [Blautia sp.]|nr:glycosyltransferase family 2 protein [Blautia sp.]
MKKVDVLIPSYRPDDRFSELLLRLMKQEYPIHKIIVMNTQETYWNCEWQNQCPKLEVHHILKEEFDHGGTRRRGMELSEADIVVCMTQDAMPANARLIGNLIQPIQGEVGASYARQLPAKDCSILEKYTRSFNYPEVSSVKGQADVLTTGIKTYFCSNVCAAYDKKIYDASGGFPQRAIFNEDMIYAATMIQNGYKVAYASDAKVIHSHNYSCMQQFHRNFDLGVSQAEHPEIFQGIPSEGEGIRLVKKSVLFLLRTGRIWLMPQLFFQSAFKYAGYFLGKRYQKLPVHWMRFCTM